MRKGLTSAHFTVQTTAVKYLERSQRLKSIADSMIFFPLQFENFVFLANSNFVIIILYKEVHIVHNIVWAIDVSAQKGVFSA